jgi:hypothetical protein
VPPARRPKYWTMRWVRTRSRSVSLLALLALAAQLALSFGHIHLRDVLGEAHAAVSTDAATLASSDEQRASAHDTDGSHHEHDDEYCAIYAINGLIGSAQHAEPPALQMPTHIGRARPALRYESPLAEFHRLPFRARAPPFA